MMAKKSLNVVITGARGRIATGILPELEKHFGAIIRVSRTAGEGCISYEDAFDADIFTHADCVIHTAWSMLPALSERHPGTEWMTDLPLLSKILQTISACKGTTKSSPTFVLLSSAGAIYGNAGEVPSTEADSPNPMGWYGHGKLAAEELLLNFQRLSGCPTLILRISNPYGFAYRRHRPQGFIAAAFHAAKEGTVLPIWGDGSALKDYIHISDLGDAICRAVIANLKGVFNISFGHSYTIMEVVSRIEELLGCKLTLDFLEAPDWDVKRSIVSRQKISSTLDWNPRVNLNQGLQLVARSSC